MSPADFTAASARMFAVNDCRSVVLNAIEKAMDAEIDATGKSEVWRRSRPIVTALNEYGKAEREAFLKAKQEAGL